jgi:hypothetical protein
MANAAPKKAAPKKAAPKKAAPKKAAPKKAAPKRAAPKKAAPKKAAPKKAAPNKPTTRKASPRRRAARGPAPEAAPTRPRDTLTSGAVIPPPTPARAHAPSGPPPASPRSAETLLELPGARKMAVELDRAAALENLNFDDDGGGAMPYREGVPVEEDALFRRWTERGEDLRRKLTIMGADRCEYRADLKDGRFVWLLPEGSVVVEARAQVLCTWFRPTHVVIMAWADPLMRGVGVARIDGMAAERDDADEVQAWELAMLAAEACGAEYVYRVPTPHAAYFLGLAGLKPVADGIPLTPGTPVGLVLRGLAETRQAVSSRAEPSDVVRERLADVGNALLYQAEYPYRRTDWVARLQRTGRTLTQLSTRLARPTYSTIAAGRPVAQWIDREVAVELVDALSMLEDEWSAFAT